MPPAPRLVDGHEVDVWSASLDAAAHLAADLRLLDDAERARAERFHFDRDRERYVLRHVFLRRVLGSYLGLRPADVALRESSRGKPELSLHAGLSFSLSHSDGLAVIAVARGREVGVDIERVREISDALTVAEELFAEPEVEAIRAAPSANRSRVFLALWTRKEAAVKALGGGLSIPLDTVIVLDGVVDTAALAPPATRPSPLTVADLDVSEDHVGAVALTGTSITVRHRNPTTESTIGWPR